MLSEITKTHATYPQVEYKGAGLIEVGSRMVEAGIVGRRNGWEVGQWVLSYSWMGVRSSGMLLCNGWLQCIVHYNKLEQRTSKGFTIK